MKREIKFRAWDDIRNKFILPKNLVYRLDGHLFDRELDEEEHNVELMQFTGVKDKNDKEIYEGDIVEFYDPYTKSQHITEVIWDDNNCRYAMKYTFVDFDFLITDEIEVIGNIYENPELL